MDAQRNPMAKINSRRKGSTFERDVAKVLAGWFGCPIRRTPLSGGWGEAITAGDVVVMPPKSDDPNYETKLLRFQKWPFSVECKHTKEISLDTFLRNPETSPLGKYLKQCIAAAKQDNKVPLLIAKKNGSVPYVYLVTKSPVGYGLLLTDLEGTDFSVCVSFKDYHVNILPLDEFLNLSPTWVVNLMENPNYDIRSTWFSG